MKRVILVSEHYYESKRKAGFHFIAEAFGRAGWEVIFVTTYVSRLSLLRSESRFPDAVLKQAAQESKQLKQIQDNFYSYVWFTPWHPFNSDQVGLGIVDPFLRQWFKRYGNLALGPLENYLAETSLFIFESTPGLMLFDRFQQANEHARYVYRVSDDLKLLGRHDVVIEAEARIAPSFDLISTPSEYLYRNFAHLPNAALNYHGLDKQAFDEPTISPYDQSGLNCIFVGNSLLDVDFVERASRLCPDYTFHIIGAFNDLPDRPNVIGYGEMPFAETVPFVKHADIGLQTRAYLPGSESLTDSLKVHQYTYCRLPIVAPRFLTSARSHMFYYDPGVDESIRAALTSASGYDRTQIEVSSILSWNQLAETLAGGVW